MSRDLSFHEWRRQEELKKSPARGGAQTPISPGMGMLGHTGVPANRPGYGPGGNIGLPAPGNTGGLSNSKYTNERPDQPDPWIDDVDMGANWYSPFQPIWPFGPPYVNRPREWDFPVGYNLNYIQPRMELMAMLKGMARTWGVLATIIATRQDQLLRIPWTIQRRDKPRQSSKAVDEMRKFFRKPDGKLSYSQWSRKLTDDLLILDAPCIYFARDRAGRPLTAEVLSGQTIFPLIDDAGRRPDSIVEIDSNGIEYLKRQPAFQQIIKGLPMVDLDESEILYCPMRPRPEMPMFGYPATEQILVEASEAVRKTFYQLNFWAEGTIPDLVVTVPDQWSPRQIAMFQAHFDAMLSGNLRLKSKVRFLPGGMKPFDIKNSSGESLWSQRDETLIRLACYAYSVSPAPFVRMLNRSTAQNAQQMAEEEGLYPLMSFWKDDIIDPIIQDRFGYDDIEFVFLPRPEPDLEKQAKIHDIKIKSGEMSRNEAREVEGLEPIQYGDIYTIQVGNAVIPLKNAAQGDAMPVQGGMGAAKPGDGGGNVKTEGPPANNVPQRGPPKPRNATPTPTTVSKWIDDLLFKVSYSDVRHAAAESEGDIDRVSHLVQHVGNYKKGHIWIQGLNISIENEKGSYRGEKDQSGKKWQVKMPTAYGYIRGTLGADNMQVDVYLGKHPKSTTVWVIDQDKVTPQGANKGFDEHKVMLGYNSLKKALKDYLKSHFDGHGHERIWAVTEISIGDFKSWLKSGDMKQPIADQRVGTVVLRQNDIEKADTISTATGLNWYSQGAAVPKPKKKRRRPSRGPRWLQLGAA
jgi:hypothetical protein